MYLCTGYIRNSTKVVFPKFVELYTESVFFGQYRSVFFGIYRYRTGGKFSQNFFRYYDFGGNGYRVINKETFAIWREFFFNPDRPRRTSTKIAYEFVV